MSEKKLSWSDARHERRQLKQKLFKIRLAEEGADIELTQELLDLKEEYESMRNFTSWQDFPDRWDIGDPNEVKKGSPIFNDVDKENLNRILGKPYSFIVHLDRKKTKE
jgi:hypothetical protein